MEEDLRALILADAGVTALVGTRVSWDERPQGSAVPAIVLWLISQPIDYDLGGAITLVETRVQADCWGRTKASAKATARALAALLSGYSGEQGGTRFQGVFQDNARDTRDFTVADPLFLSSIDFLIRHQPKE